VKLRCRRVAEELVIGHAYVVFSGAASQRHHRPVDAALRCRKMPAVDRMEWVLKVLGA
jgi:hypothetical protein